METTRIAFPFFQCLFCVVGILVSIVLPILRRFLPQRRALLAEGAPWKRCVAIGSLSSLTAVVVLAFGKGSVSNWQWFDALLAGYAWDSTLQKVVNG